MKVMLVGGTGVLSKDIAKQCLEANFDIYMINRGNRLQYAPQNAHIIIGDITNVVSLKKDLKNLEFDIVVDFLSYTPKQLSKTLELFRGKCKQYIFISSATVYSKNNPEECITEETPLTNYDWDYAKNKIICEKMLEKEYKLHKLQYTIVRPYITYGITRIPFALISKTQQWTLVDRIINNKPIVIWDDGKAICTLTHTEDFAKGVVGLFGNPKALRQAFHITSNEQLSWKNVLEKIAEAVNKKPKIIYIPTKTIEKEMPEMKGELSEDKSITRKFDNKKIKLVVDNFKCTTMFNEGIRKTVEYYYLHPNMKSIDHNWNAKIDILIYKDYKKNDPSKLNNKEYLNYLKCIIIVAFYKIYNIINWSILGLKLRVKRVLNYVKLKIEREI